MEDKLLEIEKYLLEMDIKTLSLKELTTYYNLLNSIKFSKNSEEREKALTKMLGYGFSSSPIKCEE